MVSTHCTFRSLWKAQQKRQIWFRYADEKSATPTNKIKRLTAKIATALRKNRFLRNGLRDAF
jgi:hypothetical protein